MEGKPDYVALGFEQIEILELGVGIEHLVIGDVIRGPDEIVERQNQVAVPRMDDPRRDREVLVVRSLAGPQLGSRNEADGTGYVRALDPVTGDKKWEYKMTDVSASGILTTATDVLFTGSREGFFHALDARTGKLLWRVNAGGEVAMGPMTYSVNGKQYVAFAAGGSMFVYGLR